MLEEDRKRRCDQKRQMAREVIKIGLASLYFGSLGEWGGMHGWRVDMVGKRVYHKWSCWRMQGDATAGMSSDIAETLEGCLGEASVRAPREDQSAGKHCWVLKKLRGQLASHNSQRCPSRHWWDAWGGTASLWGRSFRVSSALPLHSLNQRGFRGYQVCLRMLHSLHSPAQPYT